MTLLVSSDSQHQLIVDQGATKALDLAPQSSWFSPEYWHQKDAVVGTAQGRATTYFVKHHALTNNHTMVLRHYYRGGLIRHISNDSFVYTGLKQTRPWGELTLLNTMNQEGLAVPTGIAGLVQKSGLSYRADILTLYIPNTKSLHQVLCERSLTETQWQALGEQVKHFHNQQIYHHDLNVRNFLQEQTPNQTMWIIDFDKCTKRSGHDWKNKNIERFYRSLQKESGLASTYHFEQKCWQAFKSGYNC